MLDSFLSTMTTICKKIGDVIIEPHVITEPSQTHVEQNLKSYNDKIEYKKTGDSDFDKLMPVLNVPQLCNYEKHIAVLRQISNDDDEEAHYMVVEDDAAILPDFVLNMESMLLELKKTPLNYDIIRLGITPQTNIEQKWIPINTKILPSKECYLTRSKFAKEVVAEAYPLRFDFRTFLSHAIFTRCQSGANVRLLHFHKHACIDGSKLGLCPSTLKSNNLLVFNNEYMSLMQLMNGKEPIDCVRIRQIYKSIERLKNPDAMHLYGVLMHKAGRFDEAESMLLEAIDEMIRQGGLINRGSELMYNYICIASMVQQQKQKEEFDVKNSKYCSLYA